MSLRKHFEEAFESFKDNKIEIYWQLFYSGVCLGLDCVYDNQLRELIEKEVVAILDNEKLLEVIT